MRLVGTTKPTIESIRGRTHWNANNLQPLDPVTLGLCSQIDLDFEVEKAAKNAAATGGPARGRDAAAGERDDRRRALAAAAARAGAAPSASAEREADAVFAKLKSMKRPRDVRGRRPVDHGARVMRAR